MRFVYCARNTIHLPLPHAGLSIIPQATDVGCELWRYSHAPAISYSGAMAAKPKIHSEIF
jgi:hypothetical protein